MHTISKIGTNQLLISSGFDPKSRRSLHLLRRSGGPCPTGPTRGVTMRQVGSRQPRFTEAQGNFEDEAKEVLELFEEQLTKVDRSRVTPGAGRDGSPWLWLPTSRRDG